jgi:hypothetical protein
MQVMGSFVSFTFSEKNLCGINQILTVIAVIQIQNDRQAFCLIIIHICSVFFFLISSQSRR